MPTDYKRTWVQSIGETIVRHLSFVGPGLIAAVAYCDPGNWATDMEAGSRFGYKLLFVVLLSGLFAVLLQVLCCRLGAVTGYDLAFQTRRLVLGLPPGQDPLPDMRSTRMRLRYWSLLIPLYVINELAIIATELAELIGSAIALSMLFPKLPIWGGVLVTSADVFLVLVLYRPNTGVRLFETFIGVLVLIVLACFIVLLARVEPNWGEVFYGYVPSPTVVDPRGLYVSISILGATIMPHSLVLGSHFATIDRLREYHELDKVDQVEAHMQGWTFIKNKIWRQLLARSAQIPGSSEVDEIEDRGAVSLNNLQLHLKHSSWDIAICLVLFAITINSAILIVASAAFFYGNNSAGDTEVVADLFQAFNLLRDTVGKIPAILFAIALLAAGQSSSITVTLAGQLISEGFIHWRISPFMRRLLTRSISVIPSMLVATLVGRKGMDEMLVASQVALSMALPFVSFPLVLFTCLPKRMSVLVSNDMRHESTPKPPDYGTAIEPCTAPECEQAAPAEHRLEHPESSLEEAHESKMNIGRRFWHWTRFLFVDAFFRYRDDAKHIGETYTRAFHTPVVFQVLAWAVFLLICTADIYVLYYSLAHPDDA